MVAPVTKAERELAIREVLRYAYEALMEDCRTVLNGEAPHIKIRLVMPNKVILEISSDPHHPDHYLP